MDSHSIASGVKLASSKGTTVAVMDSDGPWAVGMTPNHEMVAGDPLENGTDNVLIIKGRVTISF